MHANQFSQVISTLFGPLTLALSILILFYQGLFVSIFVLYLKKPLTLAFSIFYSIYLFSFYCMYMHVYVYSQTKMIQTPDIFFY